MRYLTVDRFRTMATGSDLDGMSNVELASVLARAADTVDAYCNVPRLPQRYTFRGGSVTGQAFSWERGQRRVFLSHRPVRAISQFRIYATNNVYVDITPDQVFLEEDVGSAEIVALSLSPVGFWTASQLMSLTNPIARVDYTYGYEFPVADDVLVSSDDTRFQASNQFWLTTPAPEIKRNGAVITTGFTINETEGTVIFDDPQTFNDIITASYWHPLPEGVGQATAMTASMLISERDLTSKGLGNLAEVQVEEVRLRREYRRAGTLSSSEIVPVTARSLLGPYRFIALG